MQEFHHIGIPTQDTKENEQYMEGGKLFYTDPEACPYKIEWLRFEDDSPMPDVLKTVPHVSFKVDDLEAAIEGKDILIEPFEVFEGVRIAFIMHNGAPIEFMHVA